VEVEILGKVFPQGKGRKVLGGEKKTRFEGEGIKPTVEG
jgi:hypothetical protein